MRGTVQGKGLAAAMDATRSVVGHRQTLPILGSVRMELASGHLKIQATDLEQSLTVMVPAAVDTPGTIAVPAAKMALLTRELVDGTVDLGVGDGQWLSVKGQRARYRVPGMNADDFPAVKVSTDGAPIPVKASLLLDAIRRTAYAVSKDESRYSLNGMEWVASGATLRVAATDGHRLTRLVVPLESEVDALPSAIVPRTAAKALETVLKGRDLCHLSFTAGALVLAAPDGEVAYMVRLIEGQFPNIEAVIPTHELHMTVSVDQLGEAVRRVAIMAEGGARPMKIACHSDTLVLSATSPESGEAEEEVPVTESNVTAALEIGVNSGYVLDYLNGLGGGTVVLQVKDSQSPLLFGGADTQLYVVMPLRL